MFFRVKGTADRKYLQIAESIREGSKVKQRILATLGRLDELQASGQFESAVAKRTALFREAAGTRCACGGGN